MSDGEPGRMVLGRLPLYGEPEVSPDRSQASRLSAEELVVAYHERTKHLCTENLNPDIVVMKAAKDRA